MSGGTGGPLSGASGAGPGGRCLIVAEVAQAHDGSLGTAHAYIDAAARAGADAVKFQTHIAEAESTPSEPWRTKFSPQDATRYDYWKRMEFTEEQWHGLKRHADERGLQFLSSPFSLEAVDLLTRVGVAAWKIASGEVGNTQLFDRILATGLPVVLSSGMSPLAELDAVAARVMERGVPLTVLQCTSMYPCPPDKVGLNLIPFFRERYDCGVGLSDHSGTIFAGLAAAALGIDFLEVHITFSRETFGPDVASSVTTAEFRTLVDGIRFIERMRAHPVTKEELDPALVPLRSIFTKSVTVRTDLGAGTVLAAEHLLARKPGTGIPAARMTEVVGRRLRHPVRAGHVLQDTDLLND